MFKQTKSPLTLLVVCLLATALALVGLTKAVAQPPQDEALRHPLFAAAAAANPNWEQRAHARVKPMIDWQRIIGAHALVIGWADEQANPTYPNPRVVINVGRWDGTDLLALGLARTYNGKPVVIRNIGDFPKPAGLCDKLRPAKGGLAIGNNRIGGAVTLGGAVIGQGWPTNPGWKYAVSSQHVLADAAGNQAGDAISQPPQGCSGSEQLGNLIDIPQHLRLRYNNTEDPNTQDSALVPLVNHDVLSPEVIGVGVPTGSYDPPQNAWCGRKSGYASSLTPGCISDWPSTITIDYSSLGGGLGVLTDAFLSTTFATSGDSGALWFDNDRRVHGLLVALEPGIGAWYGRWQHVANGWTAQIATQ